jgi:hypothetical protein
MSDDDCMNCQWNNCTNKAVKILFRPVKGIVKDPITKKRIWNEEIHVCKECESKAKEEYRYEVSAYPEPD